jgi:hypothetical protein
MLTLMIKIKMKTTIKIINHLIKIKEISSDKKKILKKEVLAYLKLDLK